MLDEQRAGAIVCRSLEGEPRGGGKSISRSKQKAVSTADSRHTACVPDAQMKTVFADYDRAAPGAMAAINVL